MSRKPTKLKLPPTLHAVDDDAGDSLARRVPPGAPEPPASIADDPELLAAWNDLVPELDATGTLATCDGALVEMLVRCQTAARDCSARLAEESIIVRDANHGGTRVNPAARELRAQAAAVAQLAIALGIGATARSRIRVTADDAGTNPFALAPGATS